MTQPGRTRSDPTGDATVGALVRQASEQISLLVRQEMRLARSELSDSGRRLGIGGGLFGGATVALLLALQALTAALIAALALVLPVWAAALVAGAALALTAALLALGGRAEVRGATPPIPRQTIDSLKADVQEVRKKAHR